MAAEKKDVLTPKFRVAFPEVFELNKDGKFSMMLLFDKEAQATPKFKALVAKCKEIEADKWKKRPKNFKTPFKQGERLQKDTEDEEITWYAGCDEDTVAVSAWTKFAPDVVKKVKGEFKTIDSESGELYAGCYAQAYLTPFAFDHKESSNKGVSLFLGNICKISDGEKLAGSKSGAASFADDEIEDFDDSDFEGGSEDDDGPGF